MNQHTINSGSEKATGVQPDGSSNHTTNDLDYPLGTVPVKHQRRLKRSLPVLVIWYMTAVMTITSSCKTTGDIHAIAATMRR